MSTQEVLKSKGFPPFGRASKIAALAVGGVIIALVSFGAGVGVGLHKAKFSYRFGENYERNFVGGPFPGPREMMGSGPGNMMHKFVGRGFRNAHGVAGEIVSVADNRIVIKDPDGQENTISVNDKTLIKRGQDTISVNDLKNGNRIVVMGRPSDDGVVEADLIRIFDQAN